MTADTTLLREAGEALYGARWQTDLSRDLGVSDRTVRRWSAGEDLPSGVYTDLHQLLRERAIIISRLVDRLLVRSPE